MKKFIIVFLLAGLVTNFDRVMDVVSGRSAYQPPSDRVVLFATSWCGYCQKTRELFAEHRIAYVEYDIEKSQEGYLEYQRLGGRGVPVVNAYGTVIHGYSRQQILAAATASR
jgi:glutaredoxin